MHRDRIFAVALLVVLSVILVAGTDAAAPPNTPDVSWSVRDSQGRDIAILASLADDGGAPVGDSVLQGLRSNKSDVQLTFPETSSIKRMSFKNLDISQGNLELRVDEVPIKGGSKENFKRLFAIDPSSLDFDSAVVSAVAKGSYLYKCADWDFDNQICLPVQRSCTGDSKDTRVCTVTGGWKKIQKLTPGEEYTFTITPSDPGFAEYSSDFTAPYCATGESPCIANSSLLRSRDNLGTPEPNQPGDNTIDTCTDGTFGTYQTDESVENITITDYNATYFSSGDTIGVEAWVYCYGTTDDHLGLAYTNDSNMATPQWQLKEFREDGCPVANDFYKAVFNNFTLDDVQGNHSVRVYITYDTAMSPPQNTCAVRSSGNSYDDNDDVVFSVNGSPAPTVMEWGNKTVSCETWTT
ncbi:MAG TPA: hypothetical protein ENH13_03295, partial [Euryarchaeota archaeon]|nr:hypothetical protein [Euryarchaeota archaeon]